MSFDTAPEARLSQENIKSLKEFWAREYSTAGFIAISHSMKNYKKEQFWKDGEWEMIGCLDATDNIPIGGSRYLNHTVSR